MPKGIYNHKPLGKRPDEVKLKISLANKGKKRTLEQKEKYRKAFQGRTFTEETLKKMSEAHKGQSRPCSLQTRIKHSLAKKGKRKGAESHFWKGGICKQEYSIDWGKTLRMAIRERDKYTCQMCGEKQGDRAHSIHHIDYNKLNSNPANLITLCGKCHIKTNFNRENWIKFFNLKYEKDNK